MFWFFVFFLPFNTESLLLSLSKGDKQAIKDITQILGPTVDDHLPVLQSSWDTGLTWDGTKYMGIRGTRSGPQSPARSPRSLSGFSNKQYLQVLHGYCGRLLNFTHFVSGLVNK